MKPLWSEELRAQLKAQFEKLALDRGWLERDNFDVAVYSALRESFLAGFEYASGTMTLPEGQTRLKSPPKAFKGHSGEQGDLPFGATDKQIGFLKALVTADQAKAATAINLNQLEALLKEGGTLTKRDASALIGKLLKAGLKPKKQPEGGNK